MEGVEAVAQPEGPRVREEVVDAEDQQEVCRHDVVQPPLGPHGGDHPREGVLAHERVHAHTKEGGEGPGVGYGGRGTVAEGDVVEGDDEHEGES